MTSVQYNWLGSSGLKVSNICLGTMNFGNHAGGRPSSDESEAHSILDRYAELGGNFIDTADMYQLGDSERIIGNWLVRQDREKFVLATKCGRPIDKSDPNSAGVSRKHIMDSVQKSLKLLQTDYLDIFYIYWKGDNKLGAVLEKVRSQLSGAN